jgi:hypothetical protein
MGRRPPNHQAFLAKGELADLTELEGQRREGVDRHPLGFALAMRRSCLRRRASAFGACVGASWNAVERVLTVSPKLLTPPLITINWQFSSGHQHQRPTVFIVT